MASSFVLHIRPRKGWQAIDLGEIWLFRELLGFLVWRDVKIRYRQTFLGGLWAILQPLIGMVVFGSLFSRVPGLGNAFQPYTLFVFAGLVPWSFFANAIGLASNSLLGNEQMVRKTYFPRIFIPLGTVAAFGLDMVVSLGFMALLMLYYRFPVTPALIWLPVFVIGVFLFTAGLGMILAAANVQYRDIKYVVPFFTQMALFMTPVIYPMSYLPRKLRALVLLNPMAGMVEGFRHSVLGTPVSWGLVVGSYVACIVIFIGGVFFFVRVERKFADII